MFMVNVGEYNHTFGSGWWFFTNPSEKYAEVKLEIFPRVRGEKKKNI